MIDRRRFIEVGVVGSLVCGAAESVAWSAANFIGQGTGTSVGCGASNSVGCDTPESAAWNAASAAVASARPYAVLYDERFAEAIHFGRAAEREGFAVRPMRGDVTRIWYDELDPLWKRQPRPIAGLTAYAALFCLERLARDRGMRVVHHDARPEPGARPAHGLRAHPCADGGHCLGPDLGTSLHSWVIAPAQIDARHVQRGSTPITPDRLESP
jgi:hypothetical protein